MVEAMEIQKGYKKTEVGVIPSDWEVMPLGVLGDFKKGKNIPKNMLQSDGLPCVLYGEIYTKYNFHASQLTSRISNETARIATEIKYGDILFAGSGETLEDIGKCFTYSGNEKAFAGGDVNVFTSTGLDQIFLGYLLNSENINRQKSSMGQGSSVIHIYSSNLKQIQIPLPPTKAEQTAIATALNDAEALISQLEKLIAKKRNIKQGAMQELLTGKRRLPGFEKKKGYNQTEVGVIPNDWEVLTLGDLGDFKNGINKSKDAFGFGSPFVNLLDVFGKSSIDKSIELGLVDSNEVEKQLYSLKEGDVIFVRSSVKPSGVGLTILVKEDLPDTVFSGFLIRFRGKGKISKEFKEHCFYEEGFRKRLVSNSTVSANTNINQEALKSLLVALAPTKTEQTAIAQIISDMDAEIEALEKKLEKYKMIKQGMMQNLLTGRIRLV